MNTPPLNDEALKAAYEAYKEDCHYPTSWTGMQAAITAYLAVAHGATQPDYTCQYCRMGAPELCRCGKGHTQPEGEK